MGTVTKPISTNDEVAAILKGLKLDKQFFVSKLNPQALKQLGPADSNSLGDDEGAGVEPSQRKFAGAGSGFSDFDIYLNEAMMPVLAQALDALCRQIVRMEKQGSLLDAKVRNRFNPITWLAQQLLRRHPRAVTTPRRLHIYRNFKDWADYEQGRRHLLRSKKQIEEVFAGFCIRGVVGRNTLPSVLQSADDIFRLRGALKDNKDILGEVVGTDQASAPQQAGRGRRRSMLGGEGVSFEQFWYKFANTVMKHDVISFSAIQAGKELQRLEVEETAWREEAAKREEERRGRDAMEHQRLLGFYEVLYPKMQEEEGLQAILGGKSLSGDFLKPSDSQYDLEVAPYGAHVAYLEELLRLLGFDTANREMSPAADQSVDIGDGGKIFRQKVKHDTVSKSASAAGKETEKAPKEEKQQDRGSVRRASSKEMSGQREEAAETKEAKKATDAIVKGNDRWWDPSLKAAWAIFQEMFDVTHPHGTVEAKVLAEAITPPENFINLKRKVESEFERRAENGGEADDPLDMLKSLGDKAKPSLEELCSMLKMTRGRLDFFHDLFESFLPKTEDGEPGVCLYPEFPAAINKPMMKNLIKELLPKLSEAEFDARFRRVDEDGSGLIEFDEFVRWVRDEEVQVVGIKAKKMTFEELSADLGIPLDLVQYFYSCFQEELADDEVDKYPKTCFELTLSRAYSLVGLLTPNTNKKDFEDSFRAVDVAKKGAVSFDEFLECINLGDFPTELRQKYNVTLA